jgi:hypothetical protein
MKETAKEICYKVVRRTVLEVDSLQPTVFSLVFVYCSWNISFWAFLLGVLTQCVTLPVSGEALRLQSSTNTDIYMGAISRQAEYYEAI